MKHLLLTTIAAVVSVGCGEGTRHLNLYEAAESGDIEAVKQHLADGTDIELKCTGCGSTALGHAAKYGHNEIAELLIENGADVDAKDEDGSTPLHLAALMGYKEIAELLIAKGADVNAKKDDGSWTSLHSAAMTGSNEIV
ncbi:MAG: ankyrin repeat domain-containing protein, partial [Verrucomicrobiota bacterium]|nr:ankyrin repeat domain-containing protein [Verrucomicrobiota bacterium]